jgi:hypothetical protein
MSDEVEELGGEASAENESLDADLLKAYMDERLWGVEKNLRIRLCSLQVPFALNLNADGL